VLSTAWLVALPCLAAPSAAWLIELRYDWRLASRLNRVPGVIKSS